MDNLMNNRNIIHNAKMEQKMNLKNSKRNSKLSDDDEDKFSDDSLEDTSLPPSAPPIVVPPPPSLSAPVTPSKRHSIAWEVNLDDLCSTGNVFGSKVRFLHIFITFGAAHEPRFQGWEPGSKFRLSSHPWHNLRKALLLTSQSLPKQSCEMEKVFTDFPFLFLETLELELNFVSWHKPPSFPFSVKISSLNLPSTLNLPCAWFKVYFFCQSSTTNPGEFSCSWNIQKAFSNFYSDVNTLGDSTGR